MTIKLRVYPRIQGQFPWHDSPSLRTKHPAGALVLVDPDAPLPRRRRRDRRVHHHRKLRGAAVRRDAVDD